jgi:acylphosphatase
VSERSGAPGSRFCCRVHGTVQGVGFRWFVRDHARRMGLRGTVANLPDGAVEVHAEGPVTSLAALRALLFEGPPGAAVVLVDERPSPPGALPDPFTILR